jgi:hypothetical protein
MHTRKKATQKKTAVPNKPAAQTATSGQSVRVFPFRIMRSLSFCFFFFHHIYIFEIGTYHVFFSDLLLSQPLELERIIGITASNNAGMCYDSER